ncbi:patatin family protein [Vibrio sp. D415a]|uniref:patatin-like phospholipase family protein n=1 Tax=Vibrio TaxID=662 RepID=UPI00255775A1|nr:MULTISPECIES: patatin family protein [unclassified Vibrio]EJX1242752.1 patatin family protein [Vibrio alginolyticus]MDK9729237.1 patatin family protein [Vibrio sp. D415a]MDK9745448.1 patatin family protein [Vibrio sp. D409a]MDK9765415.1 patatin family protein [Vibrio sp. D417a]MDK9786337.1 patatin family protein [Vibrio sp. D421a]
MEKVGSRALIVEGGAMRGVFSCGILDHFLASEFSPFDSFWGVSAGASNLAAYLAKMPGRNLKIYLDYSLRKEFISPSQLLRGGDMMNLDWMWNVTLEELGIDKSALKADSRPFFLGVTRQDNGQAEYHLPDIDDLAETMKASSALPVLYRNGVSLNGIQYVDGGVSDALPVAEAINRGAKKIMVLRSQPASYQKPRGRFSALTRRMLKETPGLIEPMLTREVRYNQTLALINNPPPGIEIIQVCPPETFKLKRLSRSPAPLRHAYELGIEAGKEAIIRWSQK